MLNQHVGIKPQAGVVSIMFLSALYLHTHEILIHVLVSFFQCIYVFTIFAVSSFRCIFAYIIVSKLHVHLWLSLAYE